MATIISSPMDLQDDRTEAIDDRTRDLRSGLVSLIVHFSGMILLGLVVSAAPVSKLVELSIDVQGDNEPDGGGPDELPEADAAPVDAVPFDAATLADAPLADAATLANVASEFTDSPTTLDVPLPLESSPSAIGAHFTSLDDGVLSSFASGLGSGGGSGGGHGLALGDGEGFGHRSSTSIFGLSDEGGRIVYVFDRSDSMNRTFVMPDDSQGVVITPLEAAKAELLRSLGDLALGTEFSIIFYNAWPEPFPDPEANEGISTATTATLALAQAYVYAMVAYQDTHHLPALSASLELEPDVIFLLTDAEAKDDPSPRDVNVLARMFKKAGTRVNIIHFCFEPRGATTLRELASKTGGKFKSVTFRSLFDASWRNAAGNW